ncbi:MAG: hypothetical protein COB02_07690 [Candidatus Cloacimonadota bacterium]|nr:MAG: hypothetical protein COB02_07690 [Candidatus Cloacimonadota bacterium]
MELYNSLENINNRDDFVKFVDALRKDLEQNTNEWENLSLNDYLEAISAWTSCMESAYKNNDEVFPKNPDWKMFGRILYIAKLYE